MNAKLNGNAPAFPVIEEFKTAQYNGEEHTTATCLAFGLTKREQFAMAALQGILSCGVEFRVYSNGDAAKSAVMYADKLLVELERVQQ